jgi:hypothetical protein
MGLGSNAIPVTTATAASTKRRSAFLTFNVIAPGHDLGSEFQGALKKHALFLWNFFIQRHAGLVDLDVYLLHELAFYLDFQDVSAI